MVVDRYRRSAELLGKAVRTLAVGTGTIQQRVEQAASDVTLLREDALPPDLRERFRLLVRRLTSNPAVGEEGKIAATARAMSDEDASGVARQIADLADEVEAAYQGRR